MTDRSAYTAGLRALADLLDAHPDVPLPYTGRTGELLWILNGAGQREKLQTIARALPGPVRKNVRGSDFDLFASLDGLKVQVIASRDAVCQRVVTGTREVERPATVELVIPAKPARVEVVEDVEWVCEPLLAAKA